MTDPEPGAVQAIKEAVRQSVWCGLLEAGVSAAPHGQIPPFEGQHRAAERLRRWPPCRGARTMMVSPDEALLQVRLNALQDGKRLIMASPGLREGFYELTGQDLPLSHWSRAVRASGVQALGRRLGTSRGAVGRVDLLITGAVAVDVAGRRVGKGKGFFDLAFAILDHLGCIEEETPMVGLVHERQILPGVPCSPGDVPLDWIITPERCIPCQGRGPRPNGIPWERLSFRQIRQMRPLWEIRRMPGERASGV